jgi:hypothetical protein
MACLPATRFLCARRKRESQTFSYRRSGSNRPRRMTLDAFEFIRRFLRHVLPGGFQKVRHFGFSSPKGSESIEAVRWLVRLSHGLVYLLWGDLPAVTDPASPIRCPACGGPMHLIGFLPPGHAVAFDTS